MGNPRSTRTHDVHSRLKYFCCLALSPLLDGKVRTQFPETFPKHPLHPFFVSPVSWTSPWPCSYSSYLWRSHGSRILRLFQKRMAIAKVHLAPQSIHSIVMCVNKTKETLRRRAGHGSVRARNILKIRLYLFSREFREVEVDLLVLRHWGRVVQRRQIRKIKIGRTSRTGLFGSSASRDSRRSGWRGAKVMRVGV